MPRFSENNVRILTIPGLGNSGPDHWQSRWERQFDDVHRVDLGLWDTPNRNAWLNRLNLEIHQSSQPAILVAHSLSCHLVAWWAALEKPAADGPVLGALLVAPPEVDVGIDNPWLLKFAPSSRDILPFPSIVVASQNDPWCNFDRARRLASLWGSRFADAGDSGHINADSHVEDWDFGQFLLRQLQRGTAAKSSPANTVFEDQLTDGPISTTHHPVLTI